MGIALVTETRRNFSNWAYWRLRLDEVVHSDPCPSDLEHELEPWRARVRDRLAAMLGPRPAVVPLNAETTESVDRGPYTRERIVFDTEATMSVPAYLLVPHARRDELEVVHDAVRAVAQRNRERDGVAGTFDTGDLGHS